MPSGVLKLIDFGCAKRLYMVSYLLLGGFSIKREVVQTLAVRVWGLVDFEQNSGEQIQSL